MPLCTFFTEKWEGKQSSHTLTAPPTPDPYLALM